MFSFPPRQSGANFPIFRTPNGKPGAIAPGAACQKKPPARSSCGRSRRKKIKSVISGGMYVGNDTSHDGRDDFFARNRVPSVMQPSSNKWRSHLFDSLPAEVLHTRTSPREGGGLFCNDSGIKLRRWGTRSRRPRSRRRRPRSWPNPGRSGRRRTARRPPW